MDDGLIRCHAASRCREGETIVDPETGKTLERLGAVIHEGPLCDSCAAHVLFAVRSLPIDMVDLSRLLPPSLAPKLRDPDLPEQPRVKKAAPLPMNNAVWGTIELIVHETTEWARSTALAMGLSWDRDEVRRMAWQLRVEECVGVLENNLATFLKLHGVVHPARSRTLDAAHGHDPDRTIRSGVLYWTTRDGWEGGLKFTELHRDTEKFCGRHPGDRIRTPCPACHSRTVVREHHNDRVVCRSCDHAQSDEQYESFLDAALRSHGIPVDDDGPTVVERRQNPIRIRDIRPGHEDAA